MGGAREQLISPAPSTTGEVGFQLQSEPLRREPLIIRRGAPFAINPILDDPKHTARVKEVGDVRFVYPEEGKSAQDYLSDVLASTPNA